MSGEKFDALPLRQDEPTDLDSKCWDGRTVREYYRELLLRCAGGKYVFSKPIPQEFVDLIPDIASVEEKDNCVVVKIPG